jgi:DNA methylase/ParB/Sulfiredoxin domain
MPELTALPVDHLTAHPQNPRLRLRDDVVTQITAEITRSGFGQEHALLVRPVGNDRYEIISGHHRHAAAIRAGLTEVPCWVRDMDDDEAFMQLILTNTQGELSPLEEGHHVYYYVQRSKGGRGKEGGLREYSRRLNRDVNGLMQRRKAYEVYENCIPSLQFPVDVGLKNLYEISKAAEPCWTPLASAMVDKGWTVKETARAVGEAAKFAIPDQHTAWLPPGLVLESYLRDGRPTPTATDRLIQSSDSVLNAISNDGTDKDTAEFKAWLVANTAGESWDHRKISGYHADLIRTWAERRDQADGGRIRTYVCAAKDLIDEASIEAGSADLIFTDPPYPVEFINCWTELGELAVKALKHGGLLVAYTGQYTMLDAADRLRAAGLEYFWCYAIAHDGAFFRMNATHVQCGWKPLLVMRNGTGDLPNWHKDFVSDGSREKTGDEWQQSEAEAAYWISELSHPDDLILDPFLGSGTTAAACKELGRRFAGCDINENDVETARRRLA